jgi:hypothetical protein
LQLPFREQACFVQALLLLSITVLALRGMSFQRWQSILARLAPLPSSRNGWRSVAPRSEGGLQADVRTQQAQATARMVSAAARRSVLPSSCLHNSLVLWWLLRWQRIGSEIRLGGRKENDRFEAHAWVEVAGEALNEADDVRHRFAPFEHPGAPGEAWSR